MITLNVNGKTRDPDIPDSSIPLLWTLLAANAEPRDTDIVSAMAGNICRCGTYPRIRAAIKKAAG